MLTALLARSAARDVLEPAWADYCAGRPQHVIQVQGRPPVVKVERLLTKLLVELPDEPLERIVVDARSGCSSFTGRLQLEPSGVTIEFDWDCAWKAQTVGYVSWGAPDQQRAAREFGYDCFRRFERVD